MCLKVGRVFSYAMQISPVRWEFRRFLIALDVCPSTARACILRSTAQESHQRGLGIAVRHVAPGLAGPKRCDHITKGAQALVNVLSLAQLRARDAALTHVFGPSQEK